MCVVYRPPSPLQFGACDLRFSFLGSGGESTELVGLDQKFEEEKLEDESGINPCMGWPAPRGPRAPTARGLAWA